MASETSLSLKTRRNDQEVKLFQRCSFCPWLDWPAPGICVVIPERCWRSLEDRECAYSQGYTEQFLAHLARAQAAERLTETMARWTWSLWQTNQTPSDQTGPPAVFYVDGLSLAVYSAVLVPRGPVGKLDGKILGCRELVLLHDAQGHPLLATTHRGDQHLTIGLPHLLHCYNPGATTGMAS